MQQLIHRDRTIVNDDVYGCSTKFMAITMHVFMVGLMHAVDNRLLIIISPHPTGPENVG